MSVKKINVTFAENNNKRSIMLFGKIDFSLPETQSSLTIKASTYTPSWKFYYEQYNTALDYITTHGRAINSQHMSFLFLFRHSIELMLKTNIDKENITVPFTHSLEELANEIISFLPEHFISSLAPLDCKGQGDCFKYLESRDNVPFFNGEILEVLQSLVLYTNVSKESKLYSKPFSSPLNPNNKKINGKFSFYTNECKKLGIIKTHYDTTITQLLQGSISGYIDINKIYLPLLFLIRHSIELSLKNNLHNLGSRINIKDQNRINSQHSIESLYNRLDNYIIFAIKRIPQASDFLQETNNYRNESYKLKQIVHNLDTYSQAFRFPFNKDGTKAEISLADNTLLDICSCFYKVDPYLCLAVDVLMREGYLEVGDDILAKMFEV